jgi:hypothetical protein
LGRSSWTLMTWNMGLICALTDRIRGSWSVGRPRPNLPFLSRWARISTAMLEFLPKIAFQKISKRWCGFQNLASSPPLVRRPPFGKQFVFKRYFGRKNQQCCDFTALAKWVVCLYLYFMFMEKKILHPSINIYHVWFFMLNLIIYFIKKLKN